MSDHAPSSPFGCVTTWGEPVRDGGIHVCDRELSAHEGDHVCHCGDTLCVPKGMKP